MCPYCDAKHLFYDREALIDSSFRHIPSTFILNEDGKMEQTSKLINFLVNLQLSHYHKLHQCVTAVAEFTKMSPDCKVYKVFT